MVFNSSAAVATGNFLYRFRSYKVAWRSERRTFQTIITMTFLICLSMITKAS
jgi:hypothetical protein